MKQLIRVPVFFALLIIGTFAFAGAPTTAGSYAACQAKCEEQGLSVQDYSPVDVVTKHESGTQAECICG